MPALKPSMCAADHLKTSLTTAVATSLLAWGLLEFPQARPLPCSAMSWDAHA